MYVVDDKSSKSIHQLKCESTWKNSDKVKR